ncbi:MAG: hypothetical protein LBS21_16465 [Clostridiales bacterium]|jgi:hypothetical protein|nr:hypothetical protein [Clostridiales bacterium]
MRRITAYLLSLVLLLIFPVKLGATEPEEFTFSAAENVRANRGETITVPVSVSGNTGFAAVGFTVTYNTNVLEIIRVEQASDLPLNPEFALTTVPGSQIVHLVNAQTGGDWFGSGTIFNITFSVKPDAPLGESIIGLSYTSVPDGKPAKADGSIADAALISGRVIITEGEYGEGVQNMVNTVYPFPNSEGLPSSGRIAITFNSEMNPGGNLLLDALPLTGGMWTLDGKRFIVPYSGLSSGTHTLTLSDDIEHAFTNSQGVTQAKYEWSFGVNANSVSGITGTNPADGAAGISATGTIEINLSEAITELGSIYLDGGKLDLGWGEISEDGRRITISYIMSNGWHDVLLTGFKFAGGTVTDYTFMFKIGNSGGENNNPDNSANLINMSYPFANSLGNEPDGLIFLDFSQRMNPSYGTVNVDGITLSGGKWSLDGLRYSIPYYGLSSGIHNVTVPGDSARGFRDFSGAVVANEVSWSFDVRNSSGSFANVYSTVPPNGAAYVSGNSDVLVNFSRPVAQVGTVYVDGKPLGAGAGFFNSNMTQFRIPNPNLPRGWHDVIINGFTDSGGAAFSYAFRFEVGDSGGFIGGGGNSGGNFPGNSPSGNSGGDSSGGGGNSPSGGSADNGGSDFPGGGSADNGGRNSSGGGLADNGSNPSGGNSLLNFAEGRDADYYYNLVEESYNNDENYDDGYFYNTGGYDAVTDFPNNPTGSPSAGDYYITEISDISPNPDYPNFPNYSDNPGVLENPESPENPDGFAAPPIQPAVPSANFGAVPQTGVGDITFIAAITAALFAVSAAGLPFLLVLKRCALRRQKNVR